MLLKLCKILFEVDAIMAMKARSILFIFSGDDDTSLVSYLKFT